MTTPQLTAAVDTFVLAQDSGTLGKDNFADEDKKFGYQCWDLAKRYCAQVIGCPLFPTKPNNQPGGVIDSYVNFPAPLPSYFTKHSTADTKPQKGDLIFWNDKVGGTSGHVAVFLYEISPVLFVSLDQNWPTGKPVQLTTHNYTNVTGLLRPRIESEEMITTKYELDALLVHFRGRVPGQDEVDKFINKVSYRDILPSLQSGPEHDALMQAIAYGRIALRDDWPKQIFTLKAQLDEAQRKVDQLVAAPSRVGLADLQSHIAQTTLQAGDAVKAIVPPQAEAPAPPKASLLTRFIAAFLKPKSQA